MGLDIIRWLDVVGMSHMVSSVMTKMDRSMYWSMYCMMYSCMMNRSRDGMDSVNRRG